jgi:hypothetical protein
VPSLLKDYNNLTDFAEEEHLQSPGYCLFLTYTWEITKDINSFNNMFNKLISEIKHEYPKITIHVILDSWFLDEKLNIDAPITFVDFLLFMTCSENNKQKLVGIDNWNFNASKFLFLTGKWDKIQRIRLFYKLQQAGLITEEVCEWSLFAVDKSIISSEYVPELNNSLQEFLKVYVRYPDKYSRNIEKTQCGGVFYNPQLFQNSLFRLISETYFSNNNKPVITEKTWDTIFNRLPFIIAGNVNTLRRLRDMGFKTFDQYLITEYDNITTKEERLNAIVANTKHWIKNLRQFKDQVNADIEHNKKRLDELYLKNLAQIEQLITGYKLNLTPLDIVDTHSYMMSSFNFKKWYNLRKGSDWPDCRFERDLYTLPDRIKAECEKFGYVFKITKV